MKQIHLTTKIFLVAAGILLSSIFSYALTGTRIVENADNYRTFRWTCNSWNVRNLNSDGNYRTLDPLYPFIAKGEPIGEDPDLEGPLAAPTATGIYNAIPYAWGVGDTIIDINGVAATFGPKLVSKDPVFLAGNFIDEVNIHYYAGVDCSGLLSRCIRFPVIKVNPSEKKVGDYYLLRPTTVDFFGSLFVDDIKWSEIRKGDILIREPYEEVINGKRKQHDGHVGIATNAPSGNIVGSSVDAIDASSNTYLDGVPPIVTTCKYELFNTNDNAVDKIHRSDGGKSMMV